MKQVPLHFMVSKMAPYSGLGDPKAHLKAFGNQMLISGDSDTVRCKMFVGTFTETTLQ